jgi:hypothetical protein
MASPFIHQIKQANKGDRKTIQLRLVKKSVINEERLKDSHIIPGRAQTSINLLLSKQHLQLSQQLSVVYTWTKKNRWALEKLVSVAEQSHREVYS